MIIKIQDVQDLIYTVKDKAFYNKWLNKFRDMLKEYTKLPSLLEIKGEED